MLIYVCGGGHLGFPIGIKNRKFVEDLPMIIPGQLVSTVQGVSEKKHFETFFPSGPMLN
jgi:hypothetical protein